MAALTQTKSNLAFIYDRKSCHLTMFFHLMEPHCSALKPFCPEVFGVTLVCLERRSAVTLGSFTDPSIEAIENFILRKVGDTFCIVEVLNDFTTAVDSCTID